MIKFILFFILPIISFSQNTIGIPEVINYNKFVYNGGLQNWDIKQDKNGILYFANNEGLLSFNGSFWSLFPLPNGTIVRSVAIGPDNNIYVGGQDEMGYFKPDKAGKLIYHSLLDLIQQKDKSFGDVWDLVVINNDLFFRTPGKIFKLSNNSIVSFKAAAEWLFMGVYHEQLIAQDANEGLVLFNNSSWKIIYPKNTLPFTDVVTSILPSENETYILATLKSGLYKLANNGLTAFTGITNESLKSNRIYCAARISKDRIVVATTNNGVNIMDNEGNFIQSFSKTEGLQNKNVLSVYTDKQSNLWLGLDNGIDFIAYNSAIKQINPFLQDGSGYTARIFHNKLYIGTSNSLFHVGLQDEKDLSFCKGVFTAVANTTGQSWSLTEINDQLILGHHEGAFRVKDEMAQPFSQKTGFWNFLPLTNSNPVTQVIGGNYKGISLFNFAKDQFQDLGPIENFSETSRYIAIENAERIWVSHPYHGVHKIIKTENGYRNTLYTEADGLPSTLNNQVFKIKNEVLVATIKGIYIYNEQLNRFTASAFYKKYFGEKSLRYLKEDADGNIWFISDKILGVFDFSGKTPVITYLPELTNKLLSGFEFIYPVNQNNIFIGGATGIFHINYEKYKTNLPELFIKISSVKIFNKSDSLLFGGYFGNVNEVQIQTNKDIPKINDAWKQIRFEFAAPVFGFTNNLEYSYRLKGFDKDWSEWTKRTEKEYTNLSAGTYTFEVKARSNLGNESAIAGFTFKILPPWYQTIWAILFYILLGVLCLYLLYKWQKKKFISQQLKYEEEQKKLMYILDLERSKKESEIVALQNEKLEADISFQNSELATSAMHLVKKGELISKIKSELSQVMKEVQNPQAIQEIKKLTRALTEDDNMDKEWEHFALHFDKVHSNFLVALKEMHPNITPNELKLSAYLRMNLTTKEIAQLMNISPRGVEISRYRLRKKLQIHTETSLFDYLIKILD
jgi:DNA-binding CsgD family transcriptional regulator